MQEWTPTQLKEALDKGASVFLKLWQKGCGPCKLSEGAVQRLEANTKYSEFTFAQISTDDYPEMIDNAGTDILPVFFIFRDRKKLGQKAGFKGLKKLEEFFDETIEL